MEYEWSHAKWRRKQEKLINANVITRRNRRNLAIQKIHGSVKKIKISCTFLTPYWYFKWFNTLRSLLQQHLTKRPGKMILLLSNLFLCIVELTCFQKHIDDLQACRCWSKIYSLDISRVYSMQIHVKNTLLYTQFFTSVVNGTLRQILKTWYAFLCIKIMHKKFHSSLEY